MTISAVRTQNVFSSAKKGVDLDEGGDLGSNREISWYKILEIDAAPDKHPFTTSG